MSTVEFFGSNLGVQYVYTQVVMFQGEVGESPTSYELRTHKSILSLAQKASRCGKAVKGIKRVPPDSILRFS